MVNIKVIDSSNMGVFGGRLEEFLNEYPDAKILFTALKGIEGGKGIFCILSYEKKEEPKPKKPKIDNKAVALAKAKREAEAELAAKKVELEKQLAELK